MDALGSPLRASLCRLCEKIARFAGTGNALVESLAHILRQRSQIKRLHLVEGRIQAALAGRCLLVNILLDAILDARVAWRRGGFRQEGHAVRQIVHQRRIEADDEQRSNLQTR